MRGSGVSAVPTLSAIEDGCDRKEVTLVLHPAIRRAIKDFEDSFYIGVRCFLPARVMASFSFPCERGAMSAYCFQSAAQPEDTRSLDLTQSVVRTWRGSSERKRSSLNAQVKVSPSLQRRDLTDF